MRALMTRTAVIERPPLAAATSQVNGWLALVENALHYQRNVINVHREGEAIAFETGPADDRDPALPGIRSGRITVEPIASGVRLRAVVALSPGPPLLALVFGIIYWATVPEALWAIVAVALAVVALWPTIALSSVRRLLRHAGGPDPVGRE